MTIIMLGSSYDSKNYEEHERNRSSYCHKPVDHGDYDEDVGEGGDPSGGGSGGVSPSNLPCFSLCFGVSVVLPSRKPWGVVYIGVFRSNEVGW